MHTELEYDQARPGEILIRLECALIELNKINADVAAIHLDAAITSLCEKHRLTR